MIDAEIEKLAVNLASENWVFFSKIVFFKNIFDTKKILDGTFYIWHGFMLFINLANHIAFSFETRVSY